MRFLSATDNRLARARPPLRPNALAISDAFMDLILLSAKQNSKRDRDFSGAKAWSVSQNLQMARVVSLFDREADR